MIVVQVWNYPDGDESRKTLIGAGGIDDEGTGSETHPNFAGMFRDEDNRLVGDTVRVAGFDRFGSPWDLLYRALRAAIGQRNVVPKADRFNSLELLRSARLDLLNGHVLPTGADPRYRKLHRLFADVFISPVIRELEETYVD